jgi:nitroimidazol reductase NimA-like FMN-containing flavoprotein (pyridoxamine 5'-phosphate oxidase superfamily)
MTNDASLDLLTRMRLGRLACTQGSQPYIVPFYFAYQDYFLYSFTTVGKKIEWMRANPLVCVEVDDLVNSQEWTSVVVSGCYEELPDTPKWQCERAFAVKLLQQYAMWWVPALARTLLHSKERTPVPVFYRIRIVGITGRCAIVTP